MDGGYKTAFDALAVLCTAHTPEADQALKDLLLTYGLERIVKNRILLSLGERGTKECVNMISEFDAWARRNTANPPPFRPHFGGYGGNGALLGERYMKKEGDGVDPEGQQWVALSYPFPWQQPSVPKDTLWLTKRVGADQWTALMLASERGSLPDSFTLGDSPEDHVQLSRMLLDTDQDGSTDLIEEYLGTAPDNPDSDGDGVLDGKDSNPLTRPCASPDSDVTAIRQAAFTVEIATHWEHVPIYLWLRHSLDVQKEEQEFYGYCGPVLRTTERVRGLPNVNGFDVKMISPEEAEVSIGVSYDMCNGMGTVYTAKKLYGRWVITDTCGGWGE